MSETVEIQIEIDPELKENVEEIVKNSETDIRTLVNKKRPVDKKTGLFLD